MTPLTLPSVRASCSDLEQYSGRIAAAVLFQSEQQNSNVCENERDHKSAAGCAVGRRWHEREAGTASRAVAVAGAGQQRCGHQERPRATSGAAPSHHHGTSCAHVTRLLCSWRTGSGSSDLRSIHDQSAAAAVVADAGRRGRRAGAAAGGCSERATTPCAAAARSRATAVCALAHGSGRSGAGWHFETSLVRIVMCVLSCRTFYLT